MQYAILNHSVCRCAVICTLLMLAPSPVHTPHFRAVMRPSDQTNCGNPPVERHNSR